jgi:hypothetical protein
MYINKVFKYEFCSQLSKSIYNQQFLILSREWQCLENLYNVFFSLVYTPARSRSDAYL